MDTRVEMIATPESRTENSVQSNKWLRVKNLAGIPYLSLAALTIMAVAASVVWFEVGGWWWFPLCAVVSAVSVVLVCRSVYEGWMQRKVMHQQCHRKKETFRETQV